MSAVQIFSLPQVVMLTYGVGATTLNFPLNRTDFRLFRGLMNPIQILIRDVDRAPVTFPTGVTPVVNILNQYTKQIIFSSNLTLVDANQSLWTFTVGPSDIADWSISGCSYTVVTQDTQGNRTALYMDRGYTLVGNVQIIDGPYPDSPSAVVLLAEDFTTQISTLYSTPLKGAAQLQNLSGLHTIAVYGDDWTGTVTVQALLDETLVTIDSQWIDVEDLTMTNLTGLANYNFTGNYYWVRYLVNTTSGTFTKILSRS